MMMNLFSVFDPTSSIFSTNLNWISTFMGFMLIPMLFWASPSRYTKLIKSLTNNLNMEFSNLTKTNIFNLIFISLIILIMTNNLLGLVPYTFTSTSHIMMTFSLALPLWLAFMMFGWMNKTNHMFAHLVPQGTPTPLMSFMVLIETISNVIRPGTLAVRLAANMIAGHLLLSLLSNQGVNMSSLLLIILISSQILLLMLESAVAIIQSYVFTILSTLYSSEVM
uniref:ATP synthase subunit a n=1 Tax=Scolopocryptops sp. 1 YG-2013 TaxID=1285684 RepID=R4IVT9_9MYRI|nr:ATP synthase F0 subunit 6 [Scolopocryptops sp. 1 YG-2013]